MVSLEFIYSFFVLFYFDTYLFCVRLLPFLILVIVVFAKIYQFNLHSVK